MTMTTDNDCHSYSGNNNVNANNKVIMVSYINIIVFFLPINLLLTAVENHR